MSDRSDHLIERAAALLRAAKAGHVVDGTSFSSEKAAPLPAGGFVANGSKPIPLPRGSAPLALAQPPRFGRPTSPSVAAAGSVSDLRASSKQIPVGIAVMEQAGLMVARTNRTRTTEEYRIVIGRILRAMNAGQEDGLTLGPEASANVVMVTSARPGEGKSFTSLNLGGSIAQNAGESVLVVDVDAKKNSLSDTLGLAGRRGFLDLVADPNLSPDELIVPSDLPNLSFLPLGTRSIVDEGGSGLGLEERLLIQPIQRLAQRFKRSLVLLDAPPCLSTSDPHTLCPAVGQVVVVVEAERTQRSEVEAAIEMIKLCPTITMLLNKVRMNSNHTFGSYDYFGSYT